MLTSWNGNIFRVTGHLNSPVTGEFPAQRPVTRSFDVFFDLRLNKRLSKHSWGLWWRHRNEAEFLHGQFCKRWTPYINHQNISALMAKEGELTNASAHPYNAVDLQISSSNIGQVLHLQEIPHTSPSRANYAVSIVSILTKIDRVITTVHSIWLELHEIIIIKLSIFNHMHIVFICRNIFGVFEMQSVLALCTSYPIKRFCHYREFHVQPYKQHRISNLRERYRIFLCFNASVGFLRSWKGSSLCHCEVLLSQPRSVRR